MSLPNRVSLLALATLSLAFLVGCGSGSNKPTPPPTGGFTNANFSGTYVFSISGTDFTDDAALDNSGTFFAVAGTLTATPGSGTTNGSLTGTIDLNDPQVAAAIGGSTPPVQTGIAATGSYAITADGRASGSLSFTFGGAAYTFGLDFVMTSTNHGLITRFDDNGTGSGTIDMQTSGVAQSALTGSYAFGLSGADASAVNPLGSVGTVTLSSSGGITSGLQDFNDNGNSTNLQALAVTGSISIAASPGSATLATGVAGFPSLAFDVWVIDSTHLKLIETDGVAYLAGDAYVSTGQSFPAGNLVFTMAGVDDEGGSLVSGGLLTSNGTATISGGLQDCNDTGNVVQAPSVNGSLSTSSGRTAMTLNGIYNGDIVNDALVTGNYTFVGYPFTYGNGGVGVELLEIDGAGTTSGTAYLQSSTSIAASQGYGLNLAGANSDGETDMIAEFSTTSTGLTGLYDVNNAGATISDFTFGTSSNPGSYSVSSNGRGTLQAPLQTNGTSVIGTLDLTVYTVDSSTTAFIESDTEQVGIGTFQLQNASGSSAQAAALPHFTMVRPSAKAAKARQNLKKK